MSDAEKAVAEAVAPAANATATPAAAPAAAAPEEKPWMADRLERERRAVLKQLGIKPEKGAPSQSAIDAAKAKIESRKEALRAAKSQNAELEAKLAAAAEQLKSLATYASVELSSLDEATRAKVKLLAGDDPAEQLKQIASIKAFAPQVAATPAPAAAPAAAAAPKAAPANTAPAAPPAPATLTDETPVAERWAQIKSIANPTQRGAALAFFMMQHGDELVRR